MGKALDFVYFAIRRQLRGSIELAQETFVRVYHHRAGLTSKANFHLVADDATNLCKHHARCVGDTRQSP